MTESTQVLLLTKSTQLLRFVHWNLKSQLNRFIYFALQGWNRTFDRDHAFEDSWSPWRSSESYAVFCERNWNYTIFKQTGDTCKARWTKLGDWYVCTVKCKIIISLQFHLLIISVQTALKQMLRLLSLLFLICMEYNFQVPSVSFVKFKCVCLYNTSFLTTLPIWKSL